MRFNIQNIADYILDQLFQRNKISDSVLFWESSNYFLNRSEIYSGSQALDKFSKNYSKAIEGLKDSNYIFHNPDDDVIVFTEIDKRFIKPIKIGVKRKKNP